MTDSVDTAMSDALIEQSVDLAADWLRRSTADTKRSEQATSDQLKGIVTDDNAVRFVMDFVDRVVRPDSHQVSANQMRSVVAGRSLPGFLKPIDTLLLQVGTKLSGILPGVVMPLARQRMRSIVGHLVAPAEPDKLAAHLRAKSADGFALNVNLLGEAVLGEVEAQRRLDELLALLEQPDIDYVSVKISAVASQLNHFAHEDSFRRVCERLRTLFTKAASVRPATFINLDMEEYHDLELTLEGFMHVLDEPAFLEIEAGIVLQAYLPDSFEALQRLASWANERKANGGGSIKVRLVKGANLAMERVDAAIHGWEQAPYDTKVEADANYKRCIDWLLQPDRMAGLRLGLASHNLFDIAWTRLLSIERNVTDRIQFEMLQGMAPSQARVIGADVEGDGQVLMYTPAVRSENFDVAISYLFRRLEENAADDNFMRHLFELADNPSVFEAQADIFRQSLALRHSIENGPRRTQDRTKQPVPAYETGQAFVNEPETDPVLVANRVWIDQVIAAQPAAVSAPIITTNEDLNVVLNTARRGSYKQQEMPLQGRQELLHRVAIQLAERRGELISTMMHEANKTFAQADGEVAEAIDFARWYGDHAMHLDNYVGATFSPFGVVAVVPPWNFPVAIPAGGVLASLAAGNAVIFKPAPETPRCAEIVAEAAWAAGVDREALQFIRTPDDHVGRHLIESCDAVILTGAAETADLFASWNPSIRLFAETSGKNALIITPNADIDLAVADLVQSAFSHSGQKCSAASLGILVGEVYESERFQRQLVDAVTSLNVGPATDIETDMSQLISETNPRLLRGLTQLDDGETWLVKPKLIDAETSLWSPGVRLGVKADSWFHRTECFGPVLGLMAATDLDQAIRLQNGSDFGLTGGVHTLDPSEIKHWVDRVEVGNAYINRAITGAIVERQPFGGWKRSSVGPGAKAGGPNYVAQLGSWTPTRLADDDYATTWAEHFGVKHDPTGLFCEANIFRYVSHRRVLLRIEDGADSGQVALARKAAKTAGVELIESTSDEDRERLATRLASLNVAYIRVVRPPVPGSPVPGSTVPGSTVPGSTVPGSTVPGSTVPVPGSTVPGSTVPGSTVPGSTVPGTEAGDPFIAAARKLGLHVADDPVTAVGRIELLHYVREQAISETLHRFGNLTTVRDAHQ